MRRWFVQLFATFFYLGYSPNVTGTAGTVGGVILFYLLSNLSLYIYISFLLGFIIFSVWVSNKASCIFGVTDPKQVVVDEDCGDIVKPPPVRSSERLPGGFGIVTDDVVAGIYANIIMQVITRVIG